MITCGTQVVAGSSGSGASLPATPADALLDDGAPSTMLGLNSSGVGEALSAAAARSRMALGTLATQSSVTASQISDSTTAGRAVLTAADAAAQRTALGLGDAASASIGSTAGTVASGPSATWPGLYASTSFWVGGESATGFAAADYITASAGAAVPAWGPGQSIVACILPLATPTGTEMIASHGASTLRGWVLDIGRQSGSRRQVSAYLYGLNASTAVALTGSEFTVGSAYVIAITIKADKSIRYSVNGAAVRTIAALSGTYVPPTSADTYNLGSPREFSPTFYPLASALLGEVRTYSTEISDADLVAACAGRTTGTIPDVATGTVSTRFLPSDYVGGLRVATRSGTTLALRGNASLRPV